MLHGKWGVVCVCGGDWRLAVFVLFCLLVFSKRRKLQSREGASCGCKESCVGNSSRSPNNLSPVLS